MPNPEGFWSYVHDDNEADGGRIVRLAHDLTAQYEMITGETINLFLDCTSLGWGANWRDEVNRALATAAFFVPILTPRYFMSSECRRELQTFAREAEQLGVKDLILPVIYVDIPGLHDDTTQDEALRLVNGFQWVDWRQLRLANASSSEYRMAVAGLAQRIADANRQVTAHDRMLVTDAGARSPGAAATDQELGLTDLLATGARVKPASAGIMNAIAKEFDNIATITTRAADDINRSDQAARGTARRLAVARRLAQDITPPAERIQELANEYATQMYDIDQAVTALVSIAPQEIDNNPGSKKAICDFFATITEVAQSVRQMVGKAEDMIRSFSRSESLSRDLRPPLRKIKQGVTILIETASVTDDWGQAIANSPVDCRD